jgi:putative peptide zinc metalloprotease protein
MPASATSLEQPGRTDACDASPATGTLMRNPRLRVSRFDESGTQQRWLYELDDAGGRSQRMVIPDEVHAWLQRLDGTVQLEAVFADVCGAIPGGESFARLRRLVSEVFVPQRILVPSGATELHAAAIRATPRWMLFKLRLMSPAMVRPLARIAAPLFGLRMLVLLVLGIVAGQVAFFVAADAGAMSGPGRDSGALLRAFGWVLTGMLGHELGHAAAAYRYGCRNTDIGVGWYLIFPVFYADLSESWRCSRRQRLVIDAGGVYFQALAIALLMGAYALWSDPALLYACALLNLSLALNLNPFLRMDGYWLASDALGVANLRRVASEAVRRRLRGVFGIADERASPAVSARGERWLIAFALGSNLFVAAVVYLISTRIIWQLIDGLPRRQLDLSSVLSFGGSTSDLVVAIGALAWQLLLLGFLCWFLGKLAFAAVRRLVRALPHGRP